MRDQGQKSPPSWDDGPGVGDRVRLGGSLDRRRVDSGSAVSSSSSRNSPRCSRAVAARKGNPTRPSVEPLLLPEDRRGTVEADRGGGPWRRTGVCARIVLVVGALADNDRRRSLRPNQVKLGTPPYLAVQ